MGSGPTQGPARTETIKVTLAGSGQFVPSSELGLYLPQALGCWKREGLDVTVVSSGGSRNSLQLLIAGSAQVITVGPDTVPQGRQEGADVISVYETVTRPDQALGIPVNSPVQTIPDLKGKTIGVPSLAANQVFYTKALLTAAGLNSETDIKLVPTGFDPAAVVQALEAGRVDALTYWSGFLAQLENAGFQFRYHQWEGLSNAPGYVMATSQRYMSEHPEVIAAMGRCQSQAVLYAMQNPEAAVRAYWYSFRENKPTDIPEDEALRREMKVVTKQLESMRPDPAHGWGYNNPEGWASYISFMRQFDLLKQDMSADSVYSNKFVDDYKRFDEAAVKDLAKQGFRPS